MTKSISKETEAEALKDLRQELFGSYILFCRTFFPLVTGREFELSNPIGRESHFITIARELTKVKRGETRDVIINVPPGHGKSVMLSLFVAWCFAEFPDSQFLYISYSKELAAKHTEFIRSILLCPHYTYVFGVSIDPKSKAKEHFKTNFGGAVKAFGSAGAITGQDAGLPNQDRFSGAVIMDDMHKPDEVHSERKREAVTRNYKETVIQRPRSPNVPILFIGQRLHEQDLPAYLMSEESERKFKKIILKGIDDAGNALHPEVNPIEMLRLKMERSRYVFYSQFQQEPVPSGGSLFKRDNFVILDEEPEMICTFITADTAETEKTYNDATAFGFWGVYKILEMGQDTGLLGLHCINCVEIRVEPFELEEEFKKFYSTCMLHPTKPRAAAIEKKSTGVTLCSVLKSMRGLKIIEVQRTAASGSKTVRYLEMQPIIASKLVSFTSSARHIELCINHMEKITANDSHAHDDICDNFYDAIKLTLIDGLVGLIGVEKTEDNRKKVLDALSANMRKQLNATDRMI